MGLRLIGECVFRDWGLGGGLKKNKMKDTCPFFFRAAFFVVLWYTKMSFFLCVLGVHTLLAVQLFEKGAWKFPAGKQQALDEVASRQR